MRIGDIKVYKSEYLEGKITWGCECETCPMSWENRGYEGECDDCGCCFNYNFNVPFWKCALPRWIKRIIKKLKGWK